MTSDDRSPFAHDRFESIDSWASRCLDGDVAESDVPDDLRVAVLERMRVFRELRSHLLTSSFTTGVDDGRRDEQIARAVTASGDPRRSHFAVSRTAFALAASFLVIIGISALLVRRASTGGDMVVAESLTTSLSTRAGTDSVEMPFATGDDIADTAAADGAYELDTEQGPDGDTASSEAKSSGIESAIGRFASVAEISEFASSLDPRFAIVEGLDRIDPEACPSTRGAFVRVELAILEDRLVRIVLFEPENFQIFDDETCELIVDSATDR